RSAGPSTSASPAPACRSARRAPPGTSPDDRAAAAAAPAAAAAVASSTPARHAPTRPRLSSRAVRGTQAGVPRACAPRHPEQRARPHGALLEQRQVLVGVARATPAGRAATASPKSCRRQPAQADSRTPTILLVDDDESVGVTMQAVLERARRAPG